MKYKVSDSNTIQAVWVGFGSLATFSFTLISTAVLSRFLIKEDYGTYKQVMYVYNTLLVVFTLGLPKAYSYFLPRYNLEYGKDIVKKINILFLIFGFCFTSLLYMGAPIIASLLNNSKLDDALKIFSITPLFILPTMGIESIMASYRKSHINALYLFISRSLMLLCVVLPVVFYKANTTTALLGFVFSSLVTSVLALYLKSYPFNKIESKSSDITYKKILKYSYPLMIAGLGGIIIKASDQFFVSRFFGTSVFADFSNGAIDLPFVNMVTGAAATILLPVFSSYVAENKSDSSKISELWNRTATKSAMILYPLISFCMIFATDITYFLYGSEYVNSAIYFRIFLFVNYFIIAPYYPIIMALGRTDFYAKVHIIIALLIWPIEYMTVLLTNNPYVLTIISAIIHMIKIGIMTVYISNVLKIKLKKLFSIQDLLKILCSSIITGTVVYYIFKEIFAINTIIPFLVVSFFIYILLTIMLGSIFHINYLSIINPLLSRFKR